MSSKIRPLNLTIYRNILEEAIIRHSKSAEPIPKLNQDGLAKVDSCLKTPFMKYDSHYPYPGFINKAAILFYCFNKTHCLENGNKRMACLTLGVFCDINGYAFIIPDDDLYKLAKSVVKSSGDDQVTMMREIKWALKTYLLKL